jgi:hypothetical protein
MDCRKDWKHSFPTYPTIKISMENLTEAQQLWEQPPSPAWKERECRFHCQPLHCPPGTWPLPSASSRRTQNWSQCLSRNWSQNLRTLL